MSISRRRLTLGSHSSRAVLALAVAAALMPLPDVHAATYDWNDFAAGTTAIWSDAAKWTLTAGDPHLGGDAYPGGDPTVLDDIANFRPGGSIGGNYTLNYTGMNAASIASISMGMPTSSLASDTLTFNINSTLNTTGNVIIGSGNNTLGRATTNINSLLNVGGNLSTNFGSVFNVTNGGRLQVAGSFTTTNNTTTTLNILAGGSATFGSLGSTGGGGVFTMNINGNLTTGSLSTSTANDSQNINIDTLGTVALGNVILSRTVGGNATAGGRGMHILNGTVTAENFQIGTSNSSSVVEVRGGTLTVAGANFAVGQNNGGRLSGIFVDGGTLIGTNAAGLVVGLGNSTVSGGTGILNISSANSFVQLEKITLAGVTSTAIAAPGNNVGSLTLTLGTLYVGSGGITGVSAAAVAGTSFGSVYGVSLSGGTVGATANWSSNANINLAGGTPITFKASNLAGAAQNITLNGNLTGGGGFTKTGAGTLTLGGAANSSAGPVAINEGAVLFTNNLSGSTVTLASGATLGGSGQVSGATIVNSGAHLAPGVPGVLNGVGTMTFTSPGGLTLNAGAILDFDFSSSPIVNDLISLTAGTLTLGGPISVNVFDAGSANPFINGGSFNIFSVPNASSFVGDVANLQIANNGTNNASNYTFSFVNNGTNGASHVVLTIAGALVGFHWNGAAANGDWATAGNWAGNAAPNAAGANVNFGGLAANAGVVNLNGDRRMGLLTINNSNPFTFNNTPGSKLILDNAGQAAAVTVTSGTHTINSDVSLDSDANFTVASRLVINGVVSSGPLAPNAGITTSGTGTLVLANNNTYAGPTTVTAGSTLQIGNGGATGSTGAGTVLVHGTLLFNLAGDLNVPNNITGTGTIGQAGAGTLTVSDLGAFTGGVAVNAGTLLFNLATPMAGTAIVNGGVFRVAPGVAFSAPLVMNGGTFDLNGNSITTASLSGNGGTLNNLSAGGDVTVTVNTGGATTFGGSIANATGTVSFVKAGTGTVTLGGVSSYSGATTVSAGVLRIANSSALGSSTLNVNAANGLLLNDGVNLPNTLVIAPGTGGAEFINVAANSTATLSGGLTAATGHQYRLSTTNTGANLVVTGTHNSNGNITIINRGNITFAGNANLTVSHIEGVLAARQGALNLTLRDDALISAFAWNTGHSQAGGGNLTLTLRDRAHIDLSSGSLFGIGTFDFHNVANATTSTTTMSFNLDGGTITARNFVATRSVDAFHVSNVNLNGVTLVAIADTGDFLPAASALTTRLQPGGVTFNTVGFNIAVGSALVNDAVPAVVDGGVRKVGAGTLTLTGASNYQGPTVIQAGAVAFSGAVNHSIGAITGAGTAITEGGTSVTSSGVRVAEFRINGAHIVRPNGGAAGASKVNTLVIAGGTNAWTGKLDLNDNALVVQAADSAAKQGLIATLKNQITSGAAGGAWNGNGITSSTVAGAVTTTTLALADNAHLNLTTYRGLTDLNANSIIIVQARNGDATLDGQVNAFDLNILAANWQTSGKIWSSGDFTGDGTVDAFDLNVLAANWQFGTGGSLQAALAQVGLGGAAAAVPEPASLAVLALGSAALLGRRRRKA